MPVPPLVDIAAIADADNQDANHIILNIGDHAIVAAPIFSRTR